MGAALRQLRAAVDVLVGIDATTLPEDCLTRGVRDLSAVDGRLDGLQARWASAAAAAGVPKRSGATSTTDWLSRTTGRSRRQAARTERMARVADAAPEVLDSLAAGEMGPDQADSVARGLDSGTLDAEDARDLATHATHLPPAAFDRERRRLEGRRHQRRLREQEDAAHAARSGSVWREDDGSLGLQFQLPPADGDLVEKALSAFVAPDPAETPDHLRRTPRQLRADALVDLCRVALAAGPRADVAGEPPRVVVHVGPAMLLPLDEAEGLGATGTTDLDLVLSASAVRRLLCDSLVQRVVIGPDGQALDVGRATRTWPNATRAAIIALDGRDRTPGSDLPPGRCEIHHIHWWSQGGETSVENGVLLGKRGHDMIHVEGWTLEMDPVTRICTWTSPDGGTTTLTYPTGTAARGAGALHDIPELRAATPAAGRSERPADPEPSGPSDPSQRLGEPVRPQSASPASTRATGPPGRGDPGRPRGPGRRDPAGQPLQLDV